MNDAGAFFGVNAASRKQAECFAAASVVTMAPCASVIVRRESARR